MGRAGAILLVVAAIALPSIGSAQQKLYKWTDANGQVHYSETVPPEYGNVPEYSETVPPEHANRDRFLHDPCEHLCFEKDEITLLEFLESQIKLTEVYLDNLRKKLADQQAEASNYRPYSTRDDARQIPQSLAIDMARTTASIAQHEQHLTRMRAEQDALKKPFNNDDRARGREPTIA